MINEAHVLSPSPNQDVPLGSESATLHLEDESFDAEVAATVVFRPQPRLRLDITVQPAIHPLKFAMARLQKRAAELQMRGSTHRRRIYLSGFTAGSSCTFRAKLEQGPLITGEDAEGTMVLFHLMNFPSFLRQSSDGTFGNHVRLRSDEYEIEIEAVPSHDEVESGLKEEGGFAVTHFGRMVRQDGGPLGFLEADRELTKLQYYLSFARGLWTGLLALRGIGSDGRITWSEWGDRLVSEWTGSLSWWDRQSAQVLESGYRGFSELWKEPYWREVISTATYWYLRSNSAGSGAGVDGGLILTQAALERLAWAREVPDSLERLAALGREKNWDGPRCLIEIRNDLVHPERRRFADGAKLPYFEAWNLGQWYLELALLHLIGFDDVYSDRPRLARYGCVTGNACAPNCAN
jgi:hypothetical protein